MFYITKTLSQAQSAHRKVSNYASQKRKSPGDDKLLDDLGDGHLDSMTNKRVCNGFVNGIMEGLSKERSESFGSAMPQQLSDDDRTFESFKHTADEDAATFDSSDDMST